MTVRCWTYNWASSDGLRHEGEILAPDKDSAYAELRKRGIRAIRVTERIIPIVRRGVRGLRKRDVAILSAMTALAIVVSVAVAVHLTKTHASDGVVRLVAETGADVRQLRISDPAVLAELHRLEIEKQQAEEAYRKKLIERVRNGLLARETANEIFRAMRLPTIP